MKAILDAKDEAADLQSVVAAATYLTQEERDMLYTLLVKHEHL